LIDLLCLIKMVRLKACPGDDRLIVQLPLHRERSVIHDEQTIRGVFPVDEVELLLIAYEIGGHKVVMAQAGWGVAVDELRQCQLHLLTLIEQYRPACLVAAFDKLPVLLNMAGLIDGWSIGFQLMATFEQIKSLIDKSVTHRW